MKRVLILFMFFLLPSLCLYAEETNTVSKWYSIGFNDAYNILPYKKDYDINKLGRKLGRLSQKKKLTQAEIDQIDIIADYNEGYLNGLYEKYRLNKVSVEANIEPVKDLEGVLTYSEISIPLKEELEPQKEGEEK
ncbi:MAG: hypothetical protein K6G00_05545 [Treponema sp.]|nr:hypothetical protein [Treponema sp.]